jgi:hypothetical protein
MTVSVEATDARVVEMDLRMPFEYGDVTVTERPLLFLSVTADVDGTRREGIASETMAPQWFIKGVDYEEALAAMLEVIDAARRHATALAPAGSVFAFWRRLYEEQERWAADSPHPPLLWGFGVSLIERGLIDAFCRARGTTFGAAVRDGSLGIDLGAVYDDLAGRDPAALLPAEPRRSIAVRHTVGHSDPLTDDEIPPDGRLDDGLPHSLTDYARADGVSYFKIKLAGDVDADVARVRDVAAAVEGALDDYAYTFDANEGYPDVEALREFWATIESDPALGAFADRLLCIEQPVPRTEATTEDTARALTAWDGPPVIIDESDDRLRSLERALECGYAGTSHKNCKGVFKGVANACLIEARNRADDGGRVLTAEDLLNVGPVALLQDLAVVATLGIEHAERNGHHYFRGLEMLPASLREGVLDAHGDLYRRHEGGFPTLDVENGSIDVGSVVDAPFGPGCDVDVSGLERLEAWRP